MEIQTFSVNNIQDLSQSLCNGEHSCGILCITSVISESIDVKYSVLRAIDRPRDHVIQSTLLVNHPTKNLFIPSSMYKASFCHFFFAHVKWCFDSMYFYFSDSISVSALLLAQCTRLCKGFGSHY